MFELGQLAFDLVNIPDEGYIVQAYSLGWEISFDSL